MVATNHSLNVQRAVSFIPDISVSLIGCGYWGSKLLSALAFTSGVRVVSVCDVQAQVAMHAVDQYQIPAWHTDPEAVINSSNTDLVVVATPGNTHFSLGREVLAAAKHLLVAKPACTKAVEVWELEALARAAGVLFAVDHTYLYSAPIHHLRRLIDDGSIGQVQQIRSVRTNAGHLRSDVSIFWDLATHDLSIIDFLLHGERPDGVSAVLGPRAEPDPADSANIFLKFPSGARAEIHVGWHSAAKRRELVISGTEGEITHDYVNAVGTIYLRRHERRAQAFRVNPRFLEDSVGPLPRSSETLPEPLRVEMVHLVHSIWRGAPPIADSASTIRIVETLATAEHVSMAATRAC